MAKMITNAATVKQAVVLTEAEGIRDKTDQKVDIKKLLSG
jgi:hypothetical protein